MPTVSTRPARPGRVKAALIKIISATVMITLSVTATSATIPAKR